MTNTELISDHHLIFAYDEAQAAQYAHDLRLPKGRWSFADNPTLLEQFHPHYTYVYKIGNWQDNREVVEAYEFYERRKRDFISHDLTQC